MPHTTSSIKTLLVLVLSACVISVFIAMTAICCHATTTKSKFGPTVDGLAIAIEYPSKMQVDDLVLKYFTSSREARIREDYANDSDINVVVRNMSNHPISFYDYPFYIAVHLYTMQGRRLSASGYEDWGNLSSEELVTIKPGEEYRTSYLVYLYRNKPRPGTYRLKAFLRCPRGFGAAFIEDLPNKSSIHLWHGQLAKSPMSTITLTPRVTGHRVKRKRLPPPPPPVNDPNKPAGWY
jgi:hypothetical protein